MVCRFAKGRNNNGEHVCQESGNGCIYIIPNEYRCYMEYGEGPILFDEKVEEVEKDSNHPWRMDKKTLEGKCLQYLESRISNPEVLEKVKSNPEISGKYKYYCKYLETYSDTNICSKIKLLASIVAYDVEDWASFSLSGNSAKEDIIIRTYLSRISNNNSSFLCYSYIFDSNDVFNNEEFLKDIIYINSGLFDPDNWTNEAVDYVTNLFAECKEVDKLPVDIETTSKSVVKLIRLFNSLPDKRKVFMHDPYNWSRILEDYDNISVEFKDLMQKRFLRSRKAYQNKY